ncbi:MAG: transglutaminase [Chitinophagaceae bacterium]|nr:transglutaminase [Chitinophagaceae bacterium]
MKTKSSSTQQASPKHAPWPWRISVAFIVSLIAKLSTIPIFIYTYRWLPPVNWPFHLDQILLYSLIFFLFEWVVLRFKYVVLGLAAIIFILLTIGSFTGQYSHRKLINDYAALFYNALYAPVPNAIDIRRLKPFPNEKAFRKAMNYNSPIVRHFALKAVNKHFRNYQQGPQRNRIQSLAVFKEIKSNWNYVNDPRSRDYFARASESAILMGGDCDDYSIFMASCIQSIGGICRIVLTTEHVYPELLIGNKHDLENAVWLISNTLFPNENKRRPLHYHIEHDGKIWLNLDYTATYPGGPYLAEPVLGILNP